MTTKNLPTLVLGFWDAVVECLVQFHKLDYGKAYLLTTDLRRRLTEAGAKLDEIDLFYHKEPFDVACTLAGNELDMDKYHAQYLEILDNVYDPQTKGGASSPPSQVQSLSPSWMTQLENLLESITSESTTKEDDPNERFFVIFLDSLRNRMEMLRSPQLLALNDPQFAEMAERFKRSSEGFGDLDEATNEWLALIFAASAMAALDAQEGNDKNTTPSSKRQAGK